MQTKPILAKILLLALITLVTQCVMAQETLVGLYSYRVNGTEQSKRIASDESLTLPFFDDFSQNLVFPRTYLWQNSGVITNLNYAISPITIGTATFDAALSNGELYSQLTSFPQLADALTSQPIDLNLPSSDSIYLSFMIQPQGLGYAPSERDSIILEFIDSSNNWNRVWSASVNFIDSTLTQRFHLSGKTSIIESDSLNQHFHNVMIPISAEEFLRSNFQFRFQNYASISQNQSIPGLLSNCDHWILDMVYLNSGRSVGDTIFNDIAFSKPINTLMNNYTATPWAHLQEAYDNEFSNPLEFTINYSNLGYTTWNVTRRFNIIDHSGYNSDYSFSGGAENIYALQNIEYTRNFEYDFGSTWDDSAKFTLQSYLITDDNASTTYLRYNDTISTTFSFKNYYAYDDGSAESGYGVFGEGTANAMVACKFFNYKADTVQGVMMYFNKTVNDGNETNFKLTIWDDNNGKPGNIIAQRVGVKTLYTDSLNQFTIYRITPTFLSEGTFYVGWQQVYECMMNVGFDLNNNNQSNIFVNLGSGWNNTQFNGTLMIRPIMGNMHQWPTSIECTDTYTNTFALYPNPSSSYINLKFSDGQIPKQVQIISTTGIILHQTTQYQNIDIQSLPNGIYIVRVLLQSGKTVTKKLLVQQ